GALIVDLLLGGRAIALSILSDFPLSGMRFYGIGNEYLGLGVAALIGAVTWEGDSKLHIAMPYHALIAIVGILTTLVVGHPAYGANFGGGLTAAAGFAVAWMLAAGVRLDGRSGVLLLLGLALLGAGMLALDALRPEPARSHMGDLAQRVAAQGPGALLG